MIKHTVAGLVKSLTLSDSRSFVEVLTDLIRRFSDVGFATSFPPVFSTSLPAFAIRFNFRFVFGYDRIGSVRW